MTERTAPEWTRQDPKRPGYVAEYRGLFLYATTTTWRVSRRQEVGTTLQVVTEGGVSTRAANALSIAQTLAALRADQYLEASR